MRNIVISLLFVLLTVGIAEAEQSSWRYYLPIDEMTGGKDYGREKVYTSVDIEGRDSWRAGLFLFCEGGGLSFTLDKYGNSDYKPVKLDEQEGIVLLRLKFDNNEPFFMPSETSKTNPGRANLYSYPELPEVDNMRKKIIKGMIKHRRLWIEFQVQNVPYIAKFDLTGFSRELAKCSKIPDTN